ncbi:MAG TPA: response regulator transcription factor [Terriglobales bacterium]|nr:response regulator transcription factor [Terriglobales bacterium]
MARILIVEDELHLAQGLRFNLEAEGHQASIAASGEAALRDLSTNGADLLVLDIMLPGMDGFEVAERLRAARQYLPILMLTARGSAEDVLRGFAAGADDYLPKPFELRILVARIQGLLRRRAWQQTAPEAAEKEIFEFAGRTFDFSNLELRVGDRKLPLTLMEANLLRFLIEHPGAVISRKEMLEQVWGLHEQTDTRAIDNFVVRLRRYIEADPARPRHLLTVRGVGYRFVPDPEDSNSP